MIYLIVILCTNKARIITGTLQAICILSIVCLLRVVPIITIITAIISINTISMIAIITAINITNISKFIHNSFSFSHVRCLIFAGGHARLKKLLVFLQSENFFQNLIRASTTFATPSYKSEKKYGICQDEQICAIVVFARKDHTSSHHRIHDGRKKSANKDPYKSYAYIG